ncbi:MAG: amino acid adenylation domain-containing protein [Vicinamibacterales bacterium]
MEPTLSGGHGADSVVERSVWREELSGTACPSPLWLDRDAAALVSGDSPKIVHEGRVPGPDCLRALGLRQQLDLTTIFCAAWGFVLGRLTGEDQVVIGVSTGAATSALPVRVDLHEDQPFAAWLSALEKRMRRMQDRSAGITLSRIREFAAFPPELPLFDSVISVNLAGSSPTGAVKTHTALSFVVEGSADGAIVIKLDGAAARFDDWTIRQMLRHLLEVLRRIGEDSSQHLTAVALLDTPEQQQQKAAWNRTHVEHRGCACIHELFAARVALHPDAPAVVLNDRSLTYGDVDLRSSQLARYLIARGVRPGDRVALYLNRTPEMIIALMAILKAGAAYLPLDFSAPIDRLGFMLADADVRLLVSEGSLLQRLPAHAGETVVLEDAIRAAAHERTDALPRLATADSLAYVNYTSGSTGTPKGVEIVHRSVNRLVCAVQYVDLGTNETLLHAAPLSFDASTFEIWGALLNGGLCVLFPDAILTPAGLARTIREHRVTTVWLTAAFFNAVIDQDVTALRGIRQLLIGGEALSVPHVRRALDALPDVQIINGYGPTETTTFATCHRITRPLDSGLRSIPIGRPIRNTQVHVLDGRLREVPLGAVGELYIGGDGLARGYLNRPELTAEKFVTVALGDEAGVRLYRSGDRVRLRPEGTLDFVGRADSLVKLRGFRIELGEIEQALTGHPAVSQAVVIVSDAAAAGKRIVAYMIAGKESDRPTTSELRQFLADRLPDYMMPAAFVWLVTFPVTANGKLDRRALPAPGSDRPDLSEVYLPPRSAVERLLCSAFADVLALDRVGVADGFFDLGGNSLLCLRLLATLRTEHSIDVPVVAFFRTPTVEGLARYLESEGKRGSAGQPRREGSGRTPPPDAAAAGDGVAIIGMAGRFPGAEDVEQFWRNLCSGVESITSWTDSELDPSVPASLRGDAAYVRARGVLPAVDMFDAEFFGVHPREAEVMDPQQRLFLETAWEALEHAGYVAHRYAGSIGIYGGMNDSSYFSNHISTRQDLINRVGAFQAMVGHEKDYLTTRVAHRLGLTGPALNIQTACSTSLVAVAEAFFSLRAGRCDMALAGGVSVTCPPRSGYLYQEGAMLSVDGHTRPFDAAAKGTVFSDGVGIVVLKRLADAVTDGDSIYAVIRGAGVNSDGAARASFAAPSADGQMAVVAMAQRCAGVEPRTISYVEAHGTATPLGDPIEIEGLTRAFRLGTDDSGFCAVGSVKGNLGHLVMAAGAAGLIKTALALSRGRIPPTLHFAQPNPRIDFASSPFYVNANLAEWPRQDGPRRAGVSSFGVGGTNAHLVLEEAPPVAGTGPATEEQLLVLSARTPAALDNATANLTNYLAQRPEVQLADVAFTLQTGRRDFAHRRMLVASSPAEAVALLAAGDSPRVITRHLTTRGPSVAMMFPGQGSQYSAMGSVLYRNHATFRAVVDQCAEILLPHVDGDLRSSLYSSPAEGGARTATGFVQPALFVTEYAMARLWQHWGVQPQALIGHSVGEFVCATLAGVFTLEDALRIVAVRGRMMQELPNGAMLSVRLPAPVLEARLEAGLSIASANGPTLSVASGPIDLIDGLRSRLEVDGISCRTLRTSHAFHSSMMDALVEPFADVVRSAALHEPALPIMSTVTGTWLTPALATDPLYWARHLRETVRFSDAVTELLKSGDQLLLEVGPGSALATLARQHVTDKNRRRAVPTASDRPELEERSALNALGQLWLEGVDVQWQEVHESVRRRRVPLPTYPFERKSYWIDATVRNQTNPDPESIMQKSPTATSSVAPVVPSADVQTPTAVSPRKDRLVRELQQLLEDTVGLDSAGADVSATFLELGVDSLSLTQAARQLQKTFGIAVTFRQLMEDFPSLRTLADHLDSVMPAEVVAAEPASNAPLQGDASRPPTPRPDSASSAVPVTAAGSPAAAGTIQAVIDQQLRLMAAQLALLGGQSAASPDVVPASDALVGSQPGRERPPVSPSAAEEPEVTRVTYDAKKAFGAIARIHLTSSEGLDPKPKARLQALVRRYTARTRESKRLTELNRPYLADPRAVSGFRPVIKELVYPVVVDRSKGSRLWDVDGNEYVDVLCGFGSGFFGWQPDFVTDAVKSQIDRGLEIGPQHPLAGEVARSLCAMTGFDRAAFCNTGSEAVMGAMRIARTVTGRDTIVIFSGAYHGIFDEVIVRGTKSLRTLPAAPGILASACQNVLVLDYGTDESLEIIRSKATQLAAVMVEPVQSRRPDFQPREFLEKLRTVTEASGSLLIFDEMITGFRVHPRGAQWYFGVSADLATYGKLIGGGYPIGVIAGRRAFMDALDGGAWQFGDASMPTVGVTYFAGTFVRHPLALSAARAVLSHLEQRGPTLQQEVNDKTAQMAAELNAFFTSVGAPLEIRHFGSMWKTFYTQEQPFGDLLCVYLRDRGVHILDGFPCFLSTAHSDVDVAFVVRAFREAVVEMQEAGFLPAARGNGVSASASEPPVPGAKLGRDPDGTPAWYAPDPVRAGQYVRVAAE